MKPNQFFFLSLVIFLFSNSALAQWNTVGNGLSSDYWGAKEYIEMSSTEVNGDIYVVSSHDVHFTNIYGNDSIYGEKTTLSIWNSTTWYNYDVDIENFWMRDVEFLPNGNLYLFGNTNDTIAFYEYDILNDSVVPISPRGYSSDTTFPSYGNARYTSDAVYYNNKWVIGGHFIADNGINNLMTFNWSLFDTLPYLKISISDIAVFNNELYVSGENLGGGNIQTQIKKLDTVTNNWVDVVATDTTFSNGYPWGNYNFLNSPKFMEFNNSLYIVDYSNIFSIQNDTLSWEYDLGFKLNDYAEVGNYLYMVGDSSLNFTRFDGNAFTSIYGAPDTERIESLNGELFMFSKTDTVFNGITYNRAFRNTPNFTTISGYIYDDINGDCSKDANESGIEGVVIDFDYKPNGGWFNNMATITNSNGFYSLSVPVGKYPIDSIYFYGNKNSGYVLNNSCSMPDSVNVGSSGYSINIPMTNPIPVNMKMAINGGNGFTVNQGNDDYVIEVHNSGSDTLISTNLTLDVPSTLTINSASGSPTQTGNQLVYNVANMLPNETRFMYVGVDASLNNKGDTIKWLGQFDPIVGDIDLSDNTDTLIQVVDDVLPNSKQVNHAIVKSNNLNKLSYFINFQNTTGKTVSNLIITDTIDANSFTNEMVLNNSSHPFEFSLNGNTMIWTFNNINLTDSAKGFVNFTLTLDSNLNVNDTVYNTANIYFDYLNPVVTNSAKTAVVAFNVNIEESNNYKYLNIYPNPTNYYISLDMNLNNHKVDYHVYDLNGKLVLKGVYRDKIDVTSLEQGLYVIQFNIDGELVSNKIIIN